MKQYITTNEDGSQHLVTVWDDGAVELAHRPHQWAVWSPAVQLDPAP